MTRFARTGWKGWVKGAKILPRMPAEALAKAGSHEVAKKGSKIIYYIVCVLDTEKIVTKFKKKRTRYINGALESYNRLHKRRLLSKQLSKESKLVSKDSLEILAEFEKLTEED